MLEISRMIKLLSHNFFAATYRMHWDYIKDPAENFQSIALPSAIIIYRS